MWTNCIDFWRQIVHNMWTDRGNQRPNMSLLLTVALSVLLWATSAQAQMDIYIFAGQSNMVGQAPTRGEPQPQNAGRLMMYNQFGDLVPAKDPTSVYYPDTGVGPALWTADRLATHYPGRTIGIVNCAVGGTWMRQWAADWDQDSYYGRMMACAKNAQSYGTIRGFFWYQGESDSDTAADLNAYGSQMYWLFHAIHQDLGVPIVFVQLGPDPHEAGFPYWGMIQRVQTWISEAAPPWVSMVTAKDLSCAGMPSPHHLNQASQIILGQRLGDAMYELLCEQAGGPLSQN
jgi:Carbohydrate esterase, sialic acid-specific acetylesterase